MKNKEIIIEQQKDFIKDLKNKTLNFIKTIDKSEIETILLSGSVSRGDYFPGKIDGMVDLIIMRKNGSSVTAESLFGPNQDPVIPYHCVKIDNIWYAILFTDSITVEIFKSFDEPRKFSVLEAQILYDPDDTYKNELEKINQFVKEDLNNRLNDSLGYIHYLISDYKKNRWYRRDAFIQMHENLNVAVRAGVHALFYMNGFYSPAEDRAFYYSHSLKKVPQNYEELFIQICSQKSDSEEDYFRREKLFMEQLVKFVEENRPA